MSSENLALQVDEDTIQPVNTVRDLGVTLDSELSMQRHVNKVACSCFHHIRRLKQVHHLLGHDVTMRLVSAFVLSRLDHCNAVLVGLPKSTTIPLQRAQNAAARLVTGIGLRDHVIPALQQLRWLPVQYRTTFKLCLLMHKIHTNQAPFYLTDKVTATADLQFHAGLRSDSTSKYQIPRTRIKFRERSFYYADNLKLFCFKGRTDF